MGSSDAPPPQPKRATKNRYIPPEIIEEILVNLPVKPLLRFSTVSKSWNSMILGSRFVKKYLIRAAALGHERIVLKHYLYGDPPSYFPLSAVSPEHSRVDSEAATALVIPFEDTVSIKAFCDEMFYLEDPSNRSVFLWSPSLREYFVLPTPNFDNEEERLEGREVTHNEAYLLDEKKMMFGAGELSKSIASDISTGTSHVHSQIACDDRLLQMQQQLEEEREAGEKLVEQTKELQDALQTQQHLILQFMSQSRGDANHPPPF